MNILSFFQQTHGSLFLLWSWPVLFSLSFLSGTSNHLKDFREGLFFYEETPYHQIFANPQVADKYNLQWLKEMDPVLENFLRELKISPRYLLNDDQNNPSWCKVEQIHSDPFNPSSFMFFPTFGGAIFEYEGGKGPHFGKRVAEVEIETSTEFGEPYYDLAKECLEACYNAGLRE